MVWQEIQTTYPTLSDSREFFAAVAPLELTAIELVFGTIGVE